MSSFDLAVGQVWCDESGDEQKIAALTDTDVCIECGDGWLSVYGNPKFLNEHSITKHQNGADIDEEAYTYAVGDDDAPEYWYGYSWVVRGLTYGEKSFTRTPKEVTPKEPVIEELEVEASDHGWLEAGGYSISEWLGRADFRGFKFKGAFEHALPWAYQDDAGDLWQSQHTNGTRTLVHASHVLQEVAK
jgi:hypothetical protein